MGQKKRLDTFTSIQPPIGKKITFEEGSDVDKPTLAVDSDVDNLSSAIGRTEREKSQEEDTESQDEAPETVDMGAAMQAEKATTQREARMRTEKSQAARVRSQAIQSKKDEKRLASSQISAGRMKGKRPKGQDKSGPTLSQEGNSTDEEDEGEDVETKRLRKRMEAAMAQAGDEESDMNDEESDDNEVDDSDRQSFHTDSEDDADTSDINTSAEDENVRDDTSDDSENLDSIQIDPASKAKWSEMQKMMEAAAKRSGLSVELKPENQVVGKSEGSRRERAEKRKAEESNQAEEKPSEEEDSQDETQYNLVSRVKPLPQSILQAAAQAEAEKAHQSEITKTEQATDGNKAGRRKRRKIERPKTSRRISDKTTLRLLPPTLSTTSSAGLPPVFDPRIESSATAPAGKASINKFYSRAMRNSGSIPERRSLDGRKRAVGHLLR
ncbi:hypothetical protein L204_100063 [Cryptococcus depauperatus]|nr:hypothetical protein L204_02455 [Cryptococcus depauperatus CBS 7855]